MALAEASIARHNGRYVARVRSRICPKAIGIEGRRIVIVEFPTMAKLKEWHTSDDYAEALAISKTDRRLLFVPGLDD